jgi:nucleoside-diphosphate-sugar epimerase
LPFKWVNLCRCLVDAAKAAGVKRVVLVSSILTVGQAVPVESSRPIRLKAPPGFNP